MMEGFAGTSELRASAWLLCRVAGNSMLPLLPAGTMVLLEPLSDFSAVSEGDILGFLVPNSEPVLHRILSKIANPPAGIMHGDNSAAPDPGPVGFANILGRLIAAERFPGDWQRPRSWTAAAFVLGHKLGIARLTRALLRFGSGLAWEKPSWHGPMVIRDESAGTFLILDLTSGESHALNSAALRVYELLLAGKDPSKIAGIIAADHSQTAREDIESDVAATIAQLKRLGIVSSSAATAGKL